MDLQEGIKLMDSARGPQAAPRITLSSGIGPAPDVCRVFSYQEDIFISYDIGAVAPHADWREATASEEKILFSEAIPAERGSWIAVVRIPDRIIDALNPALSGLRAIPSLAQANRHFSLLPQLKDAYVYANQFVAHHGEVSWPKGVRVNPPGLPTVTVDSRSGRLVGLHVDNWMNTPLQERDSCPNRIVMNLGSEDRYLLYVNLPLTRVWDLAYDEPRPGPPMFEPDLIPEFCRKQARYPAVRLRIGPGEAYIAPTDNIIHDGSTVGMTGWDLYFTVIGYFGAQPIET